MCHQATILVIDDDLNLRTTMTLILEQAGYKVTTATSAEEGLAYLRRCCFALAFWDVVVPAQDGLALIPEIRRLHPRLPLIILTTQVVSESERETFGKDISDCLTKPIQPECLLAHIRALCPADAAPSDLLPIDL